MTNEEIVALSVFAVMISIGLIATAIAVFAFPTDKYPRMPKPPKNEGVRGEPL